MAPTFVLALIAFIGLCSAAPKHVNQDVNPVIVNYDIDNYAPDTSGAERIVGGTPTTVDVHPYIVQMEFFSGVWNQACAANILGAFYVLSAAHCTHPFSDPFYRLENRRIRAGATHRNLGGILRDFAWVLNHDHYLPTRSLTKSYYYNHDSDISLIRLSQPLTLGATMQAIPIVPPNYYLPDNVPILQAGWGATSIGGFYSDVLQNVTVNSINMDLCTERYHYSQPPLVISGNMICTGILNVGGKDACQGDAGGPLYYGGSLVGIVSWSQHCGDSYYPRFNTKVSSFTTWIVSHAY